MVPIILDAQLSPALALYLKQEFEVIVASSAKNWDCSLLMSRHCF